MIELNNKVEFYANYIKGVHEIFAHESVKKVAIGVLKLASYATLIVPIIFGIGYLIAKSKRDNLSELKNRVSVQLTNGVAPSQKELSTYLVAQVADGKKIEDDVFKKLETQAQSSFFAQLAKTNKITQAMDQTPKDTKEITFSLGKFIYDWPWLPENFEKPCKVVNEWKTKIFEFKELQKMTLDLSGIAYYTPKIELGLLHRIQNDYQVHKIFKNVNIDKGTQSDTIFEGGVGRPNNYSAVSSAVHGLVKYWSTNDKLENVEIRFRNEVVRILKKDDKFFII